MSEEYRGKYLKIKEELSNLLEVLNVMREKLSHLSPGLNELLISNLSSLNNIVTMLTELNNAHFEELRAQLDERAEILKGYSELATTIRELLEKKGVEQ